MKKSILTLCALLLCAAAGTAVSAQETELSTEAASVKEGWMLYTSASSELYTIEVPDDYIELSADTLDTLMDTVGEDIFENAGLDLSILGSIDYSNTDYLYSADMLSNLNVQISKASGLTQDMIASMKDDLDAQMAATYMAIGVAEEDCEPMDVEQIGENTFYRYTVSMMGSTMHQYIICNEDTDMFTITFTNFDEEIEKEIIESWKLL